MEIKEIAIDIETFSDVDLVKCGVYRYAESPNFEILLFAYSINNGPVQVIDLAQGEEIPSEILAALTDDNITKWAYNASFERICLSFFLRKHYPMYFKSYSIDEDTVGLYLDPSAWKCSRIWGAYMGLPLSLESIGSVLKLQDQKMKEGKDLIRYFCVPCKATKTNGGRTRNYPSDAPDKWETFKAYNIRDVEVELAIKDKLRLFPVPDFVWDEYHLDQEINDRGIAVDMQLVDNAVKLDEISKESLMTKMQALTGLDNPNSVAQMKGWLSDNGIETESLDKKAVKELLSDADKTTTEVLECRQQLAKSSVSKYTAMTNMVCNDGRARGCFAFYGANRSGRWAGRGIQLQNLPQNHMADLVEARSLVRDGNFDALSLLYDNLPGVLSELIRTAFVPKPGYKYVVADFSAIEARVLSFLADEKWRIDVFRKGEDIYCASASQMFKVPVEKHGQNAHLRQKGKIAELALGYGGSVGALKSMGAIEMGLEEEELQPLVDAWRNSNSNITSFWWQVDSAVKQAVINKKTSTVGCLTFSYQSGMLFIELPSGRRLCYVKPKMGINQFGSESVTYEGINGGKWVRIESYGPKFVENIIQAVSRDILAYAMRTLSHCFIVGHVHDELIIECPPDASLDAICEQMGRTPPWIEGLLLRADGSVNKFVFLEINGSFLVRIRIWKFLSKRSVFMPVAKEQIRQIISENNLSSVTDVYALLRDSFKDILQELMEAELDATLGYEKNRKGDLQTDNKRNGHSPKNLKSQYGEFQIDVPRDRNGEFEPKLIPKYQRDISGIEEKVISLYARGMSTRDIHDQLNDLYGIELSAEMVSKITDKILPQVKEWQSRPLNPVYPFVFMDCIHYKVREDGRIVSRAAYVVLGVTAEGYKEILSITVGANETSKFWLGMLNDLHNRGVKDVLFFCVDGLPGFKEAIQAVFPQSGDTKVRHPHAAQLIQICQLQRPEEICL